MFMLTGALLRISAASSGRGAEFGVEVVRPVLVGKPSRDEDVTPV
jgi:hypothetical protein